MSGPRDGGGAHTVAGIRDIYTHTRTAARTRSHKNTHAHTHTYARTHAHTHTRDLAVFSDATRTTYSRCCCSCSAARRGASATSLAASAAFLRAAAAARLAMSLLSSTALCVRARVRACVRECDMRPSFSRSTYHGTIPSSGHTTFTFQSTVGSALRSWLARVP